MKFSPQQDEALKAVSRWLKDGRTPVFRLFGYAGTGKTTLAVFRRTRRWRGAVCSVYRQGGAGAARPRRVERADHPFADLPARARKRSPTRTTGKTSISPLFSLNRQSPLARQPCHHRRMLDGRRGARPRPDELRHADPGAWRSGSVAADFGRRLLHRARTRHPAHRNPPPGGATTRSSTLPCRCARAARSCMAITAPPR
jgi:hypothetical protein